MEDFEYLNPACVNTGSLLEKMEYQETSQLYSVVQVHRSYRKDIHEQLRQGLIWMHKRGFPQPKLDGRQVKKKVLAVCFKNVHRKPLGFRLGKILWQRHLKDDCLGIEKFVGFLVERDTIRSSSFTSK